MPKEQKQAKEFNSEEFLNKVREAVMRREWGTAVLVQADTVKLEVVRIRDTNDLMVRVAGQKPGNALKLTTKRHLDNFIDLARMIVNNEANLLDKLNALKNVLKEDTSGISYIE